MDSHSHGSEKACRTRRTLNNKSLLGKSVRTWRSQEEEFKNLKSHGETTEVFWIVIFFQNDEMMFNLLPVPIIFKKLELYFRNMCFFCQM